MNSFPIDEVRAEFPAVSGANGTVAPVFLDNPAGTKLPRRVVDAVSAALGDLDRPLAYMLAGDIGFVYRTAGVLG